MDRIYNPDQTNDDRRFTEGDPVTDVEATPLDDKWLNDVQEELCAVATMDGDALDANNQAQMKEVIARRAQIGDVQNGRHNCAVAGGTGEAISATFDPPITTLTDGMVLRVRAADSNSVPDPTFTPNAGVIDAKTIVKMGFQPLEFGDILGSNAWISLQYSETYDHWTLLNPEVIKDFRVVNFVLAEGSNANGFWRQWLDGRIEQWGVYFKGDMGSNSSASASIILPVQHTQRGFQSNLDIEAIDGDNLLIMRRGTVGATAAGVIPVEITNAGVAATGIKVHWRTVGL